jgi:hypothetical protein
MSALASIFLSFDGRVVARRGHSRPGWDENAAGKWQAGHLTRTANEIQRAVMAAPMAGLLVRCQGGFAVQGGMPRSIAEIVR